MQTKGKLRINLRKEQTKKDIEGYSKLTTQVDKINFLAKKLGLM